MRLRSSIALLVIAALAGGTAMRAQSAQPKAPAAKVMAAKPAAKPAPKHVLVNAPDLKWGPAPPSLPPGAQVAVLDGDPSKAGAPFVLRAKMPDGYTVPPHWHPTDENIVVIAGALKLGMGDKMDETTMTTLTAGGFGKMPKQMHHSAKAQGETTIQVNAIGPFDVNYLNPNDDPRKKK